MWFPCVTVGEELQKGQVSPGRAIRSLTLNILSSTYLFESQMEMLNRLQGDGQAGRPSLCLVNEMMLKVILDDTSGGNIGKRRLRKP